MMSAKRASYSIKIRRLLEDRDLNRLVSVLRNPTDTELRLQAAQALGELEDLDATESLVRSTLEDPDAAVQAAARQSLDQLLGNRVDLVIRTYQSGSPDEDPWLEEPGAEETDLEGEEDAEDAGGIELEGLIRVASHEANPSLRLKAIRLLAQSSDMRATDMLAYLALRGESKELRDTARQAMQERFGEKAASILRGYREIARAAGGEEPDEADLAEDDEEESVAIDSEIDDEDERGQDLDEDENLEEDEDLDEGEEDFDEEEIQQLKGRPSSDFPRVTSSYDRIGRSQVVQEEGVPWTAILLGALIIAIIVIVLFLTGIL